MKIKEEIKKIVTRVIAKEYGAALALEVLIERPREASHGDYVTNIALILSKQLQQNPIQVAQKIVDGINSNLLESVNVAGPGFINFYLSKDIFVGNIKEIVKDKYFGNNSSLKRKKVIIEYTDPNILKEFHIGHLMSNAIGESLSRILEAQGAKIKRACYQSDVGLGIAKAVYGKMKEPHFTWQEAYVLGTKKYDEDESSKKHIIELNKKIFDRSDKAVNKLYDQGKKWSLEYFEGIYKKLGTRFDYYFFESEVAGFGKEIVENGLKKGVFEQGEKGAVIFKGENQGLHTRVFINSEGLPTYEAKELGLAKVKHKKFRYDASVIVTANEINEYFKVLMAAMSSVFADLAQKTRHIGHGMMRLPEGKMSSRTGKVVTAEFLIGEVKKMVEQKMSGRDVSQKEKAQIVEAVAVGAIKYSIIKQSIGSDIVYDLEKSLSFEGDSGPYLQYSYARAMSIVRKAALEKVKPSLKNVPQQISQLEKVMIYFPEAVQKAGAEFQPHYIALYLTELAREFNNYYAHNKMVDANDEYSGYKVALAQAFSVIMKNGLWMLGIQAPEKM